MTVAHLAERVKGFAKATTCDAVFAVTGCDHFTLDDIFLPWKCQQRRQE